MSQPLASSEVAMEDKERPFSKLRIIKNMVVVSLGTLFILGPDDLMGVFQSTLNPEKGVGVASVAVQYAFSVVTSFFLPKYLVLKYGSKTTMILSISLFLPFFLANYYPLYSLMIISSALLGVGFSLLWGSLDPYINSLSSLYVDHQMEDLIKRETSISKPRTDSIEIYTSVELDLKKSVFRGACYYIGSDNGNGTKRANEYKLSNHSIMETKTECIISHRKSMDSTSQRTEVNNTIFPDASKINQINHFESTTVRFFGFHSLIYQICYILSNVIAFCVLQGGFDVAERHQSSSANETCSCGASYCNVETACSEHNLQQPSAEARNVLISVCVGVCVLAAVIVITFLEALKKKETNVVLSLDVLLATFRQMKKRNHVLLTPLSFNNGLMKGFYLGDFTKSYIGCTWGIQYVGLVTACAGVTMVFFSSVSGWLVKHLGRLPIFVTAAILNSVLNVIFLKWEPNPNQPAMFFITAGLWGGVFGTFQTQARAFYGVLFKADEESAFAAYQLWYCVGACLCLSYSNYICNDIKIYILVLFSTLGIVGYLIAERSHSLMQGQNTYSGCDKNQTRTHAVDKANNVERF